LKQGEDIYANKTRVKLVKNKVAPPYTTCEFDIIFGEGISWGGELLDKCVELGLLRKSGAWFKYKEESIAMGRANARQWLKDSPEAVAEFREAIQAHKTTLKEAPDA